MTNDAPITGWLNRWAQQPTESHSAVFEKLYDRLHQIAAIHLGRHCDRHLLQTTVVLNEAFLRMANARPSGWNNREHFFAYCSRVMRHVLVDLAKKNHRLKRGADFIHVGLEDLTLAEASDEQSEDVVAVHQALKALEAVDPERARIVELRYFGGLGPQEIAHVLDLSESTVHRRWRLARAWLFDFLQDKTDRVEPDDLKVDVNPPTDVDSIATAAGQTSYGKPR